MLVFRVDELDLRDGGLSSVIKLLWSSRVFFPSSRVQYLSQVCWMIIEFAQVRSSLPTPARIVL